MPTSAAVVIAVAGLVFAPHRPSVSKAAGTAANTVVTAHAATISISMYAFHPAALTVKVGTKITVTNTDQTAHTLTAHSGAFDSGTVNPGQTKTFTVTKPGVYPYYCQFHAFMTGTLKVVQ